MGASRKGSVRRWFSSEGLRLPGHLLIAYFAFGLAALAGVALATESEGYQTLLVFVLVFGVLPPLERRYGVPIEDLGVSGDVKPPPRAAARMWGLWLAFLVPWGVLTYFVVPESLGAWFWLWLVWGPWLWVMRYVTKRELRRHGAHEWRPVRMLRDSALAGIATVPGIFAIMLWDGAGVGEALATGVACGFIVFVIVVTSIRLGRGREGGPSLTAHGSGGQAQFRPPPGWYSDPQGPGQRWWNGMRWTEHHMASVRPEAPPPQGPRTAGDVPAEAELGRRGGAGGMGADGGPGFSDVRRQPWRALLLASLAVGLYLVAYIGTEEDLASSLVTLLLLLGFPMLVGALIQSREVLAIPVAVGVLLVLTTVLELGGDHAAFADAFAIPTFVIVTALEVGCAAIGISLGRRHLASR